MSQTKRFATLAVLIAAGLSIVVLARRGKGASAPQAPGVSSAQSPIQPATPPPPEMPQDETHAKFAAQAPKPGTPAPAPQESVPGLKGKVLERLEASPYIYLRLATDKGEVWAAVPEAPVTKGAEVTVAGATAMGSFESKTLKRTFPEIYFGTLATGGAAALPPGHPPMGGDPHAKPKADTKVEVGKVAKASAEDARSVAELWAERAKLEGRSVTLRGKVVKFNEGILSRNWIHLQDGSGDAAQGTHDITVTSQAKAQKGDVVTIHGVVRTGKDFGSGYQFTIMVEEATITRK